jgi:uncharacterized protein (DUF433 family)
MHSRERIVLDPAIHHGDPCIKGSRVPVSIIVSRIADGDTFEQLIEAWPQLTADDIKSGAQVCGRGCEQRGFYPSPSRQAVKSRVRRSIFRS